MQTQTKLLTAKQLADHLNISRRTLHNRILDGLPVIRIGSCQRFDLPEVMAHLRNRNADVRA
jgi:phage terminase Nu1 subunit (DNA packaging protein)